MNLDLEFLNSDPIFEVEEHHFSSVYSKPTHLLHQFWTLSSTSIPWIDSARLGSDEGSLSEGEGGGLEKLSFGVKRDEFQRIIEQRIKVKATKWMDRRTNSQKFRILSLWRFMETFDLQSVQNQYNPHQFGTISWNATFILLNILLGEHP